LKIWCKPESPMLLRALVLDPTHDYQRQSA